MLHCRIYTIPDNLPVLLSGSESIIIKDTLMPLTGTFQITQWTETVEQELANGTKFSNAIVEQNYEGDLTGTSQVKYQLYYSQDGNAVFNGFETITLASQEQQQTLVLKHDGQFNNGVATSKFTIVASSADKSLIGQSGSFESIEGGKARYAIVY